MLEWKVVMSVGSFKPLHSGAFLLTFEQVKTQVDAHIVSNPFIAGHSFLRTLYVFLANPKKAVSNPFIAGHSFLRKEVIMDIDQGGKFQTPS